MPTSNKNNKTNADKDQFKRELMELFKRFGYLSEENDHEIKIKTTSGNIAWVNINSIKIIK